MVVVVPTGGGVVVRLSSLVVVVPLGGGVVVRLAARPAVSLGGLLLEPRLLLEGAVEERRPAP